MLQVAFTNRDLKQLPSVEDRSPRRYRCRQWPRMTVQGAHFSDSIPVSRTRESSSTDLRQARPVVHSTGQFISFPVKAPWVISRRSLSQGRTGGGDSARHCCRRLRGSSYTALKSQRGDGRGSRGRLSAGGSVRRAANQNPDQHPCATVEQRQSCGSSRSDAPTQPTGAGCMPRGQMELSGCVSFSEPGDTGEPSL